MHGTYNHFFSVRSYGLTPFFFNTFQCFVCNLKMQVKWTKSVLGIDGYHDLYISHFDLPNEDDYLVFFINLRHQKEMK